MIDMAETLTRHEDATLEVKQASGGLPVSLWDSYSAFANTNGGVIVLGIYEDKKTGKFMPEGVSDAERLVSDFWNLVNNAQKVSCNVLLDNHVYITTYESKQFVVIEVPRASREEKPVYVGSDMFKGTFRRNNEGDYHCSRSSILSMLRDQSEESADAKVIEKLLPADLDQESIKRYRTMFNIVRPNHVWTGLSDDEFLVKVGAARRGEDRRLHPTLAGLIFFGDFMTIVGELPSYFLDYREIKDADERWSDRVTAGDGDWSGNVFDFYFRIVDRLIADVPKPFKLNGRLIRDDDMPARKALRELLANALIHADYYGRCGIVIEKAPAGIKVSNPGTFRISPDAAVAGGLSDARNSSIFNMFALVGIGERAGLGLCDVCHIMESYGGQTLNVAESFNPERVAVSVRYDGDKNGQDIVGKLSETSKNVGNPSHFLSETIENVGNMSETLQALSVNEEAVYNVMRRDNTLTAKEIATEIGLTDRTVERLRGKLKEIGLVTRTGRGPGGWQVRR